MTFSWAKNEIKILKQNYNKLGAKKIQKLIPNHTYIGIKSKADILKLVHPNPNKWTYDEDEYLKNNYSKIGLTNISKILTRHSYKAISLRASANNLRAPHKYVDVYFFKKWSPEMAWCLGLLFTDGCLSSRIYTNKKKKKGHSFTVSICSTDLEIIDKYVKYTKAENKIGRVKNKNSKGKWIYAYGISICNKRVYNTLIKLGLTERKSLTIKFPSYPKKFMPDFIRGCWDGDGGVYLRGNGYIRCAIHSGSKSFIYGLSKYLDDNLNLEKHKISSTTFISKNKKRKNNKCYHMELSGENARKLCSWMYHNNMDDAYLSRKHNIWLSRNEKWKK